MVGEVSSTWARGARSAWTRAGALAAVVALALVGAGPGDGGGGRAASPNPSGGPSSIVRAAAAAHEYDDGDDAVVGLRGGAGSAAYRFLSLTEGSRFIARWDPCSTIGYRVNLAQADPGALGDVQEAIRRIANATGLRFAYRGTTAIVPASRPYYGPDYPADTQVVIAWTRPGVSQLLPRSADHPLAVGGSQWTYGFVDPQGGRWAKAMNGFVVVDSTQHPPPGFGSNSYSARGKLLMHELGHVVGLAHVSDPAQVMYPVITTSAASWGNGDRTGLRILGSSSGCLRAS